MKCKQCGFQNLEEAKFCSGCGQSLEKELPVNEIVETKPNIEIEETTKKFKVNKRNMTVACIVLLVITLVATGMYLQSLPTPLERAIEAYELDEVEAFEAARKKFSTDETAAFNEFLSAEGTEILELFKKDGIYYKEAIRRLEELKVYGIENDTISILLNEVESFHLSRSAYEEGKMWIDAKNWDNAKASFEKVLVADPNYESAQRYLSSITRWELQEIVAIASDYFDAKNYDLAIAELEKALAIDPNNEMVLKLIQDIENAKNQPPVEEFIESEEEAENGGFWQSLTDRIDSFFDKLLPDKKNKKDKEKD